MATHILVVDDDPGVRSLLSQYLQDHGYKTTEAESAKHAREALEKQSFDLIVLDVMMPQESGIDFATSIRNLNSSISILMLSAMEDPKSRVLGLKAGANDYMVKPFEPEELLLRLNNLLTKSKTIKKKTTKTLKK